MKIKILLIKRYYSKRENLRVNIYQAASLECKRIEIKQTQLISQVDHQK